MSKIAFCIMILLFPELTFQYILTELATAKLFCDRRNAIKKEIEVTEEMSIALLHPGDCCVRRTISSGRSGQCKWGVRHGYLFAMGGVQFRLGEQLPDFPVELGFEKSAEYDLLPSAEFLDERIYRRQKSDYASKAIVCIQVSWMVFETIERLIYGLPITLLELITLAQVWFALSMYGVWWYKPQGFDDPIIVDLSSCPSCVRIFESAMSEVLVDEIPRHRFVRNFKHFLLFLSVDAFVSLIYFVIHALGWHTTFPSQAEFILWRVAVCVFGGSLAKLGVWALIVWSCNDGEPPEGYTVVALIVALGCTRVIFITVAFTSLRSLPPSAYITPPDILPHFG